MKRTKRIKSTGFTLVELLTTLAVIGVLLALLIPALTSVYETAKTVKQKAQIHAITVALETFSSDNGDYPPSMYIDPADSTHYEDYSASQRLAEAIVGRDGFGYHRDSTFRGSGWDFTEGVFGPLYATEAALTDTNLAARKGPYLELENANAFKISQIYSSYGTLYETYVLADMFKEKRGTGQETGLPLLYYKANRTKSGHDSVRASSSDWTNNTYNVNDAYRDGNGIISLGGTHPMQTDTADGNAEWFYAAIQNPNFTAPARPFRSESFLIQSAGPDGLYGTEDDMFNFDQDN